MLERTSNGTISIGAKLLDVKRSLAGDKVTLLGHQIAFKATSFLDTCHNVDVFGTLGQWRRSFSLISFILDVPHPYVVLG